MLPSHYFPRLKFSKGKQAGLINNLCEKNRLNAKQLAKIIGVPPRTLSDWKREKYHISEYWLKLMCNRFRVPIPTHIDELRKDWEKERLIANKKGGLARYKKYGNFGTPEGMKKGGSKTLKILRERGILPLSKKYVLPKNKNVDLAEFVGIMLGDGGITNEQASITLNSITDKQYVNFVIDLSKKLFENKPTLIKKKDCNAVDLRFSGIKLINFLVNIGLKRGNKVKQQVGIPDWIQKSNTYKTACLRGLMDTDGCVVVSTHKIGLKKYIYFNPCFANRSKPLLKFVASTLQGLGLHPSIAGERIWLYNKAEVQAYFELIGSNNARLLKFREESHSWSIAEVR